MTARARRTLVAIAAAGVTAGCGSTVATVDGQGATATGNGLTVPGATAPSPGAVLSPGAAAGPGAVAPGVAGAQPVPTTSAGQPIYQSTTAPGTNGQEAVSGPGITPTTIFVGETYSPDTAAANSALGAADQNPGDTKAETEAVIRYLNSHGGIAGRKVVPVWHRVSVSDDSSSSAEAACQDWTKDHKVFVFSGGDFRGAGTLMDDCATRAGGIELIGGQTAMETTAVEAAHPAAFDLHGLSNDRAMNHTIAGLADLGYFSTGARVGIVTWDDSYHRYGVSHAAVPALDRLGFHDVPVSYINSPSSYGDLGATSAAVSSAVLKYSGTVDHVLLFDGASGVAGTGVLTLLWMQQAQSQHYHPRYGLNSTGGFNALASDLPAEQLVNSVGVGWEPGLEQTSSDFEHTRWPKQTKLCEQIMERAGQKVSGANARALQYMICDAFFLLKEALDPISGPVNQATAIAAFNALGTRHRSLVNFGARIDAQHRDLPYLVRNVVYKQDCGCFKYVGPVYNPES